MIDAQDKLMNEAELQDWIKCRIDSGVVFLTQKESENDVTRVARLLDINGKEFVCNWQPINTLRQ